MTREQEIKKERTHYKKLLEQPGVSLEAQTWIGVAMTDLKKELRSIRKKKKPEQ